MTELHITWDETTGNVNVNGPIQNKGVCYLMLECAKDAIRDYCCQEAPKPANGSESFIAGKRTLKPKR